MPKKTKVGKGRLDKFYHLAKEQGFRARSAFKLVQLNRKYQFLKNAKCAIDLCAAPGGWMQVCVKEMPAKSLIIGVDLDAIKPIKGCIGLQEDITTEKCRASLRTHMATWKADVVLHDGAPNVGGAWAKDAYNQAELTLHALKLASEFLTQGGWFITKVFRSKDYHTLMWVFQQLFHKVEATKPQASRDQSAEIFVTCQGFLAPKKIDPRLMDPKHVFKEVEDSTTATVDIFRQKHKERQRGGYDDGVTLLYRTAPVWDFISTSDPVKVLTDFNALEFSSEKCKEIQGMQHTSEEVNECIQDIRVLGKKDLKMLLRWRIAVREDLGLENETPADGSKKAGEEDEQLDSDEELDQELSDARRAQKAREKRMKKKEAQKASRLKQHLDANFNPDDNMDMNDELFSLNTLKGVGSKTLKKLTNASVHDLPDVEQDVDIMGFPPEDEESEDEETRSKYYKDLEDNLGHLYEEYLERKGQAVANRKAKKVKDEVAAAEQEWFQGALESKDMDPTAGLAAPDLTQEGFLSSDDEKPAPYTVSLNDAADSDDDEEAVGSRWFSNPLFAEVMKDDRQGDVPKRQLGKRRQDEPSDKTQGRQTEKEKKEAAPANKKQKTEGGSMKVNALAAGQSKMSESSESESEWSSDDDFDSDDDNKAEAAAIGKALLTKKVRKDDLIDSTYNRFAFNDTEFAPEWFQDAERQHNRIQLPVTKEQVMEMKARFKDVNARSIKKVAEAKARKKKRAVRALTKAKKKAEAIAESSEMGGRSKQRAIESVLKRAGKVTKKPRKQTVVAKGGRAGSSAKTGSRVKIVDSRSRADRLRGHKKADAKKAAKKKGGRPSAGRR